MEKDIDRDMEEFVEEFAEEYDYKPYDQNSRLRRMSSANASMKGILAIWGAAILVLSLFITLFFGGRGEVSRDDLTSVNARIEEIGVQLSQLEKNIEKLGELDTGKASLKKSVAALEVSIDSIKKQMAGLSAKVEASRKVKTLKTRKEQIAKTTLKKTGKHSGRGLYHTVKKGETLFRIAEKYDLTLEELLKINNLKKGDTLKIGQKLLVVPVKK